MNNLLDEDFYNKNYAKLWWKQKLVLYNLIVIAIGFVLLFIEYRYYKYYAFKNMEFYFDATFTIKFFAIFSIVVIMICNLFYYKTGKTLNIKNKNNINKPREKFFKIIGYSLLIELFFFFFGIIISSSFAAYLAVK